MVEVSVTNKSPGTQALTRFSAEDESSSANEMDQLPRLGCINGVKGYWDGAS